MSKGLNNTERNYNIHDKEMLVIMWALYEWRHYLQGSQLKFEIWTNHKNLEYFTTTKKLNRRQARWSLELSKYDFTLIQKPGKQHAKTDTLLRQSSHEKGVQDNLNLVLLPEQYFRRMDGEEFLKAMPAVLDDTAGDQFMEDIKAVKSDWEEVVKKVLEEKAEGWEEHNDRPGIGAPGHLLKSARVAIYYNVLHYITTSSHKGYCWPEQLAKRDIMCLEPLERCWTTILVKG
jgi:hypothetical protein